MKLALVAGMLLGAAIALAVAFWASLPGWTLGAVAGLTIGLGVGAVLGIALALPRW